MLTHLKNFDKYLSSNDQYFQRRTCLQCSQKSFLLAFVQTFSMRCIFLGSIPALYRQMLHFCSLDKILFLYPYLKIYSVHLNFVPVDNNLIDHMSAHISQTRIVAHDGKERLSLTHNCAQSFCS